MSWENILKQNQTYSEIVFGQDIHFLKIGIEKAEQILDSYLDAVLSRAEERMASNKEQKVKPPVPGEDFPMSDEDLNYIGKPEFQNSLKEYSAQLESLQKLKRRLEKLL